MDIPAHVINQSYVENNIKVQGGTNWDLSRSAIETPVTELPPEPVPEIKAKEVTPPKKETPDLYMRIHFAGGSYKLPDSLPKYLSDIPSGFLVTLRGNSSSNPKNQALLQKRVQAITNQLDKNSLIAAPATAFVFDKPISGDEAGLVELYLIKK